MTQTPDTQTRIAVLGGTGKVGALVLRHGIDRGLDLATLIRPSSALAPDVTGPAVTVVRGELADRSAMARATDGCSAVIVAVGVRYRHGNPWRGIDGPDDVVPTALASLLEVTGPDVRVVMLSAFGAGQSWGQLPWIARTVISTSALKRSYAGLTRGEELLAASGRRHDVVRAVTLSDAPATGASVDATGVQLRGNPSVPRTDVAALLLDLAVARGPGRTIVAARMA